DYGAQFPKFGFLFLGDAQGFSIQFLGRLGVPLPQQQLALVPVQLRLEPTLPCPFDDLQSLVQQGRRLFNLPCHLTCPSLEGDILGYYYLRTGGAVSGQTAEQERYPFDHIAIFDFEPATIDRSLCTPEGETLLGRDRNQLVCPLAEGSI